MARTKGRRKSGGGNPRPLLAVGGVLAGTVLVAGAGTVHAELARPSLQPGVARAAQAARTPAPAPSSRAALAGQAAIAAVGGAAVLSVHSGPGGAHLARVRLPSGNEAYVIADAGFVVRSVRVV